MGSMNVLGSALDALLSSLLFLVPLLHLVASPYSKVEESFNLQATHDMLVYGTPVTDAADRLPRLYDHFTFPGAVPRTFVGAVALAGLSRPLVALAGFRHAQLVVRAVLGAFNAGSLLVFRGAVVEAFGKGTARWWVAFVVSQFHVAYYLTRTLPNMFAFGLTTLAFAFLLPKSDPARAITRRKQAIGLLVFSAAVFRSEIAILLATTGLFLLLDGQMDLATLVPVFLVTFLAAVGLSVPIDSYFWQKPVWPELWGFYFNAVLGSSSEWGVSPWHYYFTSALPRLLLNPLAIPIILFSFFQPGTSRQVRNMAIPSLIFVAIYSFQPHKEARFIFYVIPSLTGAAAIGANFISSRQQKSIVYHAGSLLIALSVLATFAGSTAMLLFSSLNYPGGDALEQLCAITRNSTSPTVSVHADVLTCMTGLTLFGQNSNGLQLALGPSSHWQSSSPIFLFDKTERSPQFESPDFWNKFDYALAEDPADHLGDWEILGLVSGYDGLEILRPGSIAAGEEEPEKDSTKRPQVLGLGADIAKVRNAVRGFTGGWWIGPRMSPRIHVMRQLRHAT